MATREYQFIVGPETSTLPSIGDPNETTDLITLGYADDHYVQGGDPVADVTALKAIAAADRTNGDVLLCLATNKLYRFDSAAADSADDYRIVAPNVGTGRWFLLRDAAYSTTFLIAGWAGPAGGYYTLTYNETTHHKGLTPHVVIQKKSGTDYYDVRADRVTTDASGNVVVRIPETPDTRFDGRVIID